MSRDEVVKREMTDKIKMQLIEQILHKLNMKVPVMVEQRPDLFSLTDDIEVIQSPQEMEVAQLLDSMSIA